MATATELRLQSRMDRRDVVHGKHEGLLAERGEGNLSETDKSQIAMYREEIAELDTEIEQLASDKEAHDKAVETSRNIRRAMFDASDGVDSNEEGVIYRTMAAYARDAILTGDSKLSQKVRAQFGDAQAIEAAEARLQLLKRTPANTLSSNIGGLNPPQHIDQIFQVIDKSRPIVASASRTTLERGQLTYPQISQRPLVAVQATEKTEAGNQSMHVDMDTVSADTYLGGGDLSWQAINWSTPDALRLWFDLAAAHYALKTEQAAAQTIIDSGQGHVLGTTFNATTGTFANLLTAIGAGAAAVFANSGRTADTVYMSMDAYWYVFGLTSTAFAQFASVNDGRVGPLNFVPSRGLHSATVVVGDSQALLVAETAGAPVELNVVEPAIGGYEVGLIGAFKSVVVDPGAFTLISAAS